MKKYMVRIRNWMIFGVVFSLLWYLVNGVLIMKRDDGITVMQDFYRQDPNSVDVLFLGSSHAGTNIDLELLWSEYGISGYALWGSMQPSWNSYYFLLEALETQSPSIVVMDVYGLTQTEEYTDEARQVTNTAGMHYGKNRLEAVMASAPKERWVDLFLGLPLYHTRYDEVDENDLIHFVWNSEHAINKGYFPRYGSSWMVQYEIPNTEERIAVSSKQEEYLRRIIETCHDEEIELILVVTPTVERVDEQPYYNYIEDIANEYDITFVNMNTMDDLTGISVEHYAYDDSHLNTLGARKVASYLGAYVLDRNLLKDHRTDARYDSWNLYAQQVLNDYVAEITILYDYLEEMSYERRVVVLYNGQHLEIPEYAAGAYAKYGLSLEEEIVIYNPSAVDVPEIDELIKSIDTTIEAIQVFVYDPNTGCIEVSGILNGDGSVSSTVVK